MEVREPAVSGTFYPEDEKELKTMIHDCFMHPVGPGKIPRTDTDQKIYGVICPHAGFVYSGPIACHSFYSISSARHLFFEQFLQLQSLILLLFFVLD